MIWTFKAIVKKIDKLKETLTSERERDHNLTDSKCDFNNLRQNSFQLIGRIYHLPFLFQNESSIEIRHFFLTEVLRKYFCFDISEMILKSS